MNKLLAWWNHVGQWKAKRVVCFFTHHDWEHKRRLVFPEYDPNPQTRHAAIKEIWYIRCNYCEQERILGELERLRLNVGEK